MEKYLNDKNIDHSTLKHQDAISTKFTYRTRILTKSYKKFFDLLYGNFNKEICLNRKYIKFKEIIEK